MHSTCLMERGLGFESMEKPTLYLPIGKVMKPFRDSFIPYFP